MSCSVDYLLLSPHGSEKNPDPKGLPLRLSRASWLCSLRAQQRLQSMRTSLVMPGQMGSSPGQKKEEVSFHVLKEGECKWQLGKERN